MRIVLVGNYNEKRAGANFYATVRKLTNGFVRNGHLVIPFSDRDVAREQGRFGVGRGGEGHVNRRLLELCENFRPDLLVLLHADKIRNDTVRKLRSMLPALRVATVNLDALFVAENVQRIRRQAEVADATFLTTAGDHLRQFVTPTHRVAFIPNPADRSIETLECFARDDQPFDFLCAIGTERTTPRRGQFMREIAARVPEARYAYYGLAERPYVYGSAYFEAIASARMGLNLNRADDHYLYSSDRFAQYAGNGLLVFVSRSTGYDEIFSDDEFAFYRDLDELTERLRYFLKNDGERQRVARNGHARYHALFSEVLVARFIEDAVFDRAPSGDYAWPTEIHSC
ncbi:glycosyltransferase [Parvibaculum sp.]|uniref:glycosyltransferase family protein n=1 Tax=Parvibaculum sp. TaxID=2024848 RepID=UPI001DAE5517|nr:glycosyltransferase [Parvibaculum sp.]MBX3488998.1 glycosyltransferase family 1 protein [Parvibaculum sp.]MCW5727133.1 glycosyltransferase family 1 protein [Parvibaculum sp.]